MLPSWRDGHEPLRLFSIVQALTVLSGPFLASSVLFIDARSLGGLGPREPLFVPLTLQAVRISGRSVCPDSPSARSILTLAFSSPRPLTAAPVVTVACSDSFEKVSHPLPSMELVKSS